MNFPGPAHDRPEDFPEQVLGELARGPKNSEDLTAQILRRLGVASGARPKRGRWGLLLVMALTLIAAGVLAQALLTPTRAPAGPTIPSAIRSDLERHERTIERAVRTIRQLTPAITPTATGTEQESEARVTEPPESAKPLDIPGSDAGRV